MKNEVHDYYDKIAADYDQDRFGNSYGQFIHQQELDYLKNHLSNGDKILNLGCGTGRFMEFCTHGSDISENMIQVAKNKFPDKKFSVSSAHQLPYKDNEFDAILCFHVIMHLDDELCQNILKEAKRVLKPGGQLIIDYPSKKRRRLFKYKAPNWHAATEFNPKDIENMFDSNKSKVKGVLFLPIHRFPNKIRKIIRPIDNLLCKSPIKQYSSYILHSIRN